MRRIRTVTGDIDPKSLGWCQCHEHIFVSDGPSRKISSALYMDDFDKSLAETRLYQQAGGSAFVDAQPYGCGRMAAHLKRVSEQTGVHIIACTGFHKTEFFEDADWLEKQTEDTLTRIYIREVTAGMDEGTGLTARAGLIKCAAVPGLQHASSLYEKLFAAAANAARETGAPVFVHFDPGADALKLAAYFRGFGIAPERLIFCHLDRAKYDAAYHMELADAGIFLEYDTIHREKYHSDEQELKLIEAMVVMGHASNLLLGLDTTNQRLKSYGAPFGLDDILTRFRFLLAERIGNDLVNGMMIDNPQKALSFEATIHTA
jgi:phosphotriesterase-related protein